MNQDEQTKFIFEVYEIAFGENAIGRNFTAQEVLQRLREFSDNALKVETKHVMSLREQVNCIKNQIETNYYVEAFAALDDLVEEFGNEKIVNR